MKGKIKKKNRFLFDLLLKLSITSFCCLFIIMNVVSIVSAQGVADSFKVLDGSGKDPVDTVANQAGYDVRAEGKTGAFDFISPLFSKTIQIGLSFLGVVFTLLIVYGGFLWMSDQGNEEQVAKAKKILTAAVIGLIIVVSSYAISIFVVKNFQSNTIDPRYGTTEDIGGGG